MAEPSLVSLCHLGELPPKLALRIVKCPSGCWEWQGARTSGYGRVWWDRQNQCVHRIVYSLLVSPVPDGLVLDHLCRNHPCCNPAHLEVIPQRINAERALRNRHLPLVVPATPGVSRMAPRPEGAWKWLPVPGYPNYEVSDRPDFWSRPRTTTRGGLVKAFPGPKGYLTIRLSRDGALKTEYVHRLVAAAFLGPCPKGMDVCHNDGNNTNNAPGNLRYDDRSGNHHDKKQHGTDRWANSETCGAGHPWAQETTIVRLNRDGSFKRRQCSICLEGWRATANQRARERRASRKLPG